MTMTSVLDTLRRVRTRPAASVDRSLFQELNPGLEYSPILSSPPKAPREAAVLIPILRRGDRYRVLFTVRSPSMPSHAGEISFPGGGPKPGDGTLVATALREAEEETGIDRERVEVLGQFGVHFGGLGYAVTPVLGLIESPGQLQPCAREVSEVFEVPLEHFTEPSNHIVIDRTFGGKDYKMFAVPYQTDETLWNIWGLTAGILDTFHRAWHDMPVKRAVA